MGLGAEKRWGFDLFLIPGLLILGLDTQYTPAQITLINYHHHPFIHIQVTCPLGINPFKKAESEALYPYRVLRRSHVFRYIAYPSLPPLNLISSIMFDIFLCVF